MLRGLTRRIAAMPALKNPSQRRFFATHQKQPKFQDSGKFEFEPAWLGVGLVTSVLAFGTVFRQYERRQSHHHENHHHEEQKLHPVAATIETKVSPSDSNNAPESHPAAEEATGVPEVKLPPLPSGTPFKQEETTVIFVLGGPGAGKGTQCEKLVNEFGFVHLSAGDLLRAERNRPDSEYGQLINHYIKEGLIVPMEITINLLERAMRDSGAHRFLIDGFPRKMDQALAFEKQVVESTFVLYFQCPEEVMLERLLKRGETSGRVDDNLESIRKRFATFRDTSFPVVEYYEKIGKVRQVSCVNPPEVVFNQVSGIFHELFKSTPVISAPEADGKSPSSPAHH